MFNQPGEIFLFFCLINKTDCVILLPKPTPGGVGQTLKENQYHENKSNRYDMRTLLATGVDGADATMFTQARTVDTSTNNAVLYRCGYTRQRIFKVTLTAGKRQMIKGLEIDFTELRG